LGPILRQPLSQAAPLQHGRKALYRRRAAATTNLARSNQSLFLRAPFASAKSFALVKFFMICPQWSADGLADHDEILPLITAISWQTYETLARNECWRERARMRWRRSLRVGDGNSPRRHWRSRWRVPRF